VYACVYVCMCVCMCVCMYVCAYLCVFVCECVCFYVREVFARVNASDGPCLCLLLACPGRACVQIPPLLHLTCPV
jgi:hypothetical protein